MPAATDVRPKDWDEILVLYDDGVYSAIWGRFRRRPFKQIGVRWNEGDTPGVGYPSAFNHPVWYVEPPFLSVSLLHGLFDKLVAAPASPQQAEWLRNIAWALRDALWQTANKGDVLATGATTSGAITSETVTSEAIGKANTGRAEPRAAMQKRDDGGEEQAWAGHWFYNTNESYGPGAYPRMFARGVAAIYGYPDGPRKLQGTQAGEMLLAYVNQQGLRALGVIEDGQVVPGQGVFLDAEGKQLPEEYHLAVRWEAITAPSDAISAAQASALGYTLPVRSTLAKLYRGQDAERLAQTLRERAAPEP